MDRRETRVAASCNGVAKELLCVRELPGGDLLILLRNTEYPIQIGGKARQVVEQRYSIHRDAKAQQVVIKHSLRIAGGRIVTIASFADAMGDARAWPVFSRLAPDLRSDRFDLKGPASLNTLDMGDYDPRMQSLCYAVVAHRRQALSPAADTLPIALARLSFREFDISVVARILPQPTTDGALMHHRAQAPMAGASNEAMSEAELAQHLDAALRQLIAVPAPREQAAE